MKTRKRPKRVVRTWADEDGGVETLLNGLTARVAALEIRISELVRACEPRGAAAEKEFYTTADVARVKGVSVFTVTARWCHPGRIEAVKDKETGRWMIPACEYSRLVRGGGPRPKTAMRPPGRRS